MIPGLGFLKPHHFSRNLSSLLQSPSSLCQWFSGLSFTDLSVTDPLVSLSLSPRSLYHWTPTFSVTDPLGSLLLNPYCRLIVSLSKSPALTVIVSLSRCHIFHFPSRRPSYCYHRAYSSSVNITPFFSVTWNWRSKSFGVKDLTWWGGSRPQRSTIRRGKFPNPSTICTFPDQRDRSWSNDP